MNLLVFICSFTQEMFSEHLLYVRLEYKDKSERVLDNYECIVWVSERQENKWHFSVVSAITRCYGSLWGYLKPWRF